MFDASFSFILIAVCRQPCMNGGVCYKPDKCTCHYDWHGKRCEKGETTNSFILAWLLQEDGGVL